MNLFIFTKGQLFLICLLLFLFFTTFYQFFIPYFNLLPFLNYTMGGKKYFKNWESLKRNHILQRKSMICALSSQQQNEISVFFQCTRLHSVILYKKSLSCLFLFAIFSFTLISTFHLNYVSFGFILSRKKKHLHNKSIHMQINART